MDPQYAVDLGREALTGALIIGGPLLLAAVAVGLIMGLIQAVTQVQEQSLSFVPKLVVMGIVLAVSLPWLIGQMVEFSREMILNIPNSF